MQIRLMAPTTQVRNSSYNLKVDNFSQYLRLNT